MGPGILGELAQFGPFVGRQHLEVGGVQPVGRGLDLWVRVAGRSGTFMLSGEVKWIQEEPDGGYLVGIQLSEKPRDDVGEWLHMIQGELQYQER